jgi:hypothetical protein
MNYEYKLIYIEKLPDIYIKNKICNKTYIIIEIDKNKNQVIAEHTLDYVLSNHQKENFLFVEEIDNYRQKILKRMFNWLKKNHPELLI